MAKAVRIKIRSSASVQKEVSDKLLPDLIVVAQDIVAQAAADSPFLTGLNRNSIGWGASPHGTANFGTIETGGLGGTSSAGGKGSKADTVAVKVATTSGYGGYLELGTARMDGRPYIIPAVLAQEKNIRRAFANALGRA